MNVIAASQSRRQLPWLFIDVDSTLVLPGGKLSSANRDALSGYCAAGGHVSLATGRHPDALRNLIETIGLPGPHVAGNGSVIIRNGRYELIEGIAEQVRGIDEYLRRSGIPFALYTPGGVYITSTDVGDSHVKLLLDIDEPVCDPGIEPDWGNVFKILAFIPKDAPDLDSRVRKASEENGAACVRTSRDFLEVISHKGGKAVAMEKIVSEAGWPIDHTAAIGDSENDLCLLRMAGFSAVVGNASEHMKSIADKVFPACADDGVAAFVEECLHA